MKQKYKVFINNEPKIILDNWDSFCRQYDVIYAAGGVVYKDDSLLMIFRNNKWDLPKGKRDLNESDKDCALREVEEECGISDLSIVRFLKFTYHTYYIEEKRILKITSWYLMNSNYKKKLIPQSSEGITHVMWVRPENINSKLENSFNNIIDLFNDV
jgi:8-oxo-dGTP pyrophosphatase MutT (NUDIX family)